LVTISKEFNILCSYLYGALHNCGDDQYVQTEVSYSCSGSVEL